MGSRAPWDPRWDCRGRAVSPRGGPWLVPGIANRWAPRIRAPKGTGMGSSLGEGDVADVHAGHDRVL